jgi:glycosyltransferase involved in cell wall biosynthesis
MNERPFVSIIIPFFNTPEKAFKRCIHSLINQTNGDFEAIIINDGSAKDYDYLLKEAADSDKRIKVIHKTNEGSAVARNVGIHEADGEYIMFLDSDDALTDFCLEEAAQVVEESHPDLVMGTVKRVSEDEIDVLNPFKNIELKLLNVGPDKVRDLLMAHMIGLTDEMFLLQNGYIGDGPVARLLRKSIAKETLFSKENFWSDDTIWNTKMLKKCESITIVDDLWYKYLIYPNSKTRRFRPNCQYEFEYRTKQEIDLFKELWPNCMEGIYTRAFNDITILCRTFLFHSDNPKSKKEKYQVYKSCIHTEAYREALHGMNLKREKRIVNRVAKELLRFSAYYGPNIISYWILKVFYNLRKDTL